MQDFLNKAGKIAKDTAGKAADKAGDMVEIGKFKANISSAKSDITSLENKIGKYYFEQYRAGEAVDEMVTGFCEDIMNLQERVQELEEKIKEVKED